MYGWQRHRFCVLKGRDGGRCVNEVVLTEAQNPKPLFVLILIWRGIGRRKDARSGGNILRRGSVHGQCGHHPSRQVGKCKSGFRVGRNSCSWRYCGFRVRDAIFIKRPNISAIFACDESSVMVQQWRHLATLYHHVTSAPPRFFQGLLFFSWLSLNGSLDHTPPNSACSLRILGESQELQNLNMPSCVSS